MNGIARALLIFSAAFAIGALLQVSDIGSSNGEHGDSGGADDPNTQRKLNTSGQKPPSLNLDSPPARPQEHLRQSQVPAQPNCTVDQLLPSLREDLQDRWVPLGVNEIRPREYDCTCPYTKMRYFCPNGRTDYPSWSPKAVADKECTPVNGDVLDKQPLPPGASVLFYGNSHLRQVLEGFMCSHTQAVVRREVLFIEGEDRENRTSVSLPPEGQCRGCLTTRHHVLSKNGCVPEEDEDLATRCCDDRAVFELDNKATIHYWFAHEEDNKSVENAFTEFGTSLSDYDVIVANVGNDPIMHIDRAVSTAQSCHDAGVSFLWLQTYDGAGDIREWSTENRQAFIDSGGKHIPVHDMMASMAPFTRGVATGGEDPHFCLPGPPNELGRLMLQLIWALYEERS